jgi:hypothetical protein
MKRMCLSHSRCRERERERDTERERERERDPVVSGIDIIGPISIHREQPQPTLKISVSAERDFFIDSLLVMILVDRPCAMGV